MSPLEDATEIALAQALASGADDAEVVAVEADSLEVGVRLDELETLQRSKERRLALRVFVAGSTSICSISDLRDDAITALARDAVDRAKATAADPHSGLPEREDFEATELPPQDLDLFDPQHESITVPEAVDHCRRCEGAARGHDPRILNSEGAQFASSTDRLVFATSRGVRHAVQRSSYSISTAPVASDGRAMERDYGYDSTCHLADLEAPESVGRRAAERALRRLGPRAVRSTKVPVLFEAEVASSLVQHFAAAASGSAIHRKASFLADRMGDRIASEAVQLQDDPWRRRGLASRVKDAEGLPTKPLTLLRDGVLQSYFLDSYSARKLGMRSTASASRAVGSAPTPGPSNLALLPQNTSRDDLIASTPRGLLVTELMGFGVNPVTGDYSRGACGQWIENGEIAHPVSEITIAGNLLEMFASIDGIADDLKFRGRCNSPTLRVAEMTVAAGA